MAPLRRLDGWDISVRKCRVSNDTICIAATTSSGVSRDSSTKGKGEYEYIYIHPDDSPTPLCIGVRSGKRAAMLTVPLPLLVRLMSHVSPRAARLCYNVSMVDPRSRRAVEKASALLLPDPVMYELFILGSKLGEIPWNLGKSFYRLAGGNATVYTQINPNIGTWTLVDLILVMVGWCVCACVCEISLL